MIDSFPGGDVFWFSGLQWRLMAQATKCQPLEQLQI